MSESARINRLLAATRAQQVLISIQRQKILCCSPGTTASASIIPVESGIEQAKSDVNDWAIVFPKAKVIYGTSVGPESARIQAANQCVIDNSTVPTNPDARFSMYRRPYVPPACAPIPTAILNANLPKPSTRPICVAQKFQGTAATTCGTL